MSDVIDSSNASGWASDIPEDWSKAWLKWNVARVSDRPGAQEASTLPYISNEDIESWTGKLLTDKPKPADDSESRKFSANDVLLNKLRPYLAKIFHAPFDGVSSGELLCLRPSEAVVPRYLFYVVSSKGFIDAIDAETFGSKMPRADWKIVGHQPLPLPTWDTQQQIAEFLDEKTARIDALIAKKRALLDRLAEKRQARITQAVTKGLDPNAPTKYSDIEWLGTIPAHWERSALNKVTTKITNGYVGPTRNMFVSEGTPYIQSLHIKSNQIVFNDDFFVTEEWSLEHSKSILKLDDVLIVQTGDIGQVARVTEKHVGCNCHALIVCSSDKKKLNGAYLAWLLYSDYGQHFLNLAKTGALHPHLNCGNVKFFSVVLPPLEEQAEIVKTLNYMVSEISEAETKTRQSIDLLMEYRQSLVASAVMGRLENIS